jgi:hypothetical protein
MKGELGSKKIFLVSDRKLGRPSEVSSPILKSLPWTAQEVVLVVLMS